MNLKTRHLLFLFRYLDIDTRVLTFNLFSMDPIWNILYQQLVQDIFSLV